MVALDFGFWEFLAVESVLLPDREMYSYLALVEVDIRERGFGRWGGVESESELAYEHFIVLACADPVVEPLELGRETLRWENPAILDGHLERLADADGEIVSGIGVYQTFSIHVGEVDGFGEHLSDWESPSFMLCLGVISGISEDSVGFSKNKLGTIDRDESRFSSLGKELGKHVEITYVLRSSIRYTIDERIEFRLLDIGEVVVLDDVYSYVEELEADAERGEPEVRGLHEDDDGALREREEFGFDGFVLWIYLFALRRILTLEEGFGWILEFPDNSAIRQYRFVRIRKQYRKRGVGIVEEVDLFVRVAEIFTDDVTTGLFERSHIAGLENIPLQYREKRIFLKPGWKKRISTIK